MPITSHTCYRATCTGCGLRWVDDLDFEPYFTSEAEARAQLSGRDDWVFDTAGDWCERCAAARHCARHGCDWGVPITGPDPEPVALQHCTRCNNTRLVVVKAS